MMNKRAALALPLTLLCASLLALMPENISFAGTEGKAKPEKLAEATMRRSGEVIQYSLEKTKIQNPVYQLVWRKGRTTGKPAIIAKEDADLIQADATRIIWMALYKRPAGPTCTEFAKLRSGLDSAKVCAEDGHLTGLTRSFVHTLAKYAGD